MSALTNLGSGNGFIYVVDIDGVSVIQNVKNTLNNVKKILLDASTSVGLSGRAGTFDSSYGKRYWLNASGVAGIKSGTEITGFIVQRGMESTIPVTTYTINNAILTTVRAACITVIDVEGEGGASDELDTLSTTDYNTGDLIILQGATAAHIITIKDSSGNIKLANAVDFLTGNLTNKIILEYNAGDTFWYEVSRTPNPALTVANLRAAGIPTPISGVEKTTLTNGGGTINIEPGVDKGIQVYDGSPNLAGSWVIQIQPAPGTAYLDGDTMFVEYRALATVNANTVTIFGITLTTEQALEGRVYLKAEYKLSNTTWYYDIFYSAFGVDVDNKAHTAATYEPKLGNPAANGYILASTTGGTRSWIPNPGGSNLWEVGGGTDSLQTKGDGATASGDNSLSVLADSVAGGADSIAIGNRASADGATSIAISDDSTATGVDSIAIGNSANSNDDYAISIGSAAIANGLNSIAIGRAASAAAGANAIGNTAVSNINNCTNISGTLITKNTASVNGSDYFLEGAAAVVTLTTQEIDLKSNADYTITISSGAKFYVDTIDIIITTLGGTFTGQPTIRAGITGTLAKLLAAVPTIGLAALFDRENFDSAYLGGVSTLTAGVTNAATGSSTIKGRFVFKGILIENE